MSHREDTDQFNGLYVTEVFNRDRIKSKGEIMKTKVNMDEEENKMTDEIDLSVEEPKEVITIALITCASLKSVVARRGIAIPPLATKGRTGEKAKTLVKVKTVP